MVAEVLAGLSAVKTALDIAKGLKDITDTTARNRAIIELQEKLLAAQMEQATLIETVTNLKKQVTQLEAWETEKQRYQLTKIGDGGFAYALKPAVTSTEAPHYICANCYEHGKKAILQHRQLPSGRHQLICFACGSQLVFEHGYRPPDHVASASQPLTFGPCPMCGRGQLVITASRPDPTFGRFGVQERTLTCNNPQCRHSEKRQFDPNK